MQNQAWTLQTERDGQARQSLSQAEAADAINRAMRGLDPFADEDRSAPEQQVYAADVLIAA
jgi:hypothetical protein